MKNLSISKQDSSQVNHKDSSQVNHKDSSQVNHKDSSQVNHQDSSQVNHRKSSLFSKQQMVESINLLCGKNEPFLFVIDYQGEKGIVIEKSELENTNILCSFHGVELNTSYLALVKNRNNTAKTKPPELELTPIPFNDYKVAFDKAVNEIKNGNSYLLNLTFPTQLNANIDLEEIYINANAPYKMLFDNDFIFYSPESFIKITENKIYSFPMKGTIDAFVDDAQNKLLNNKKEEYEHNTIVDLIRNDLSMVSRGVTVDKFRYIDRIKTRSGEILQTSSQISGNLKTDWKLTFGDLLFTLLPAGSISGAPKQKTLEIIEECEMIGRGFYCGVMGFFDGTNVDSCVMIRFIEKRDDGSFYYRSGGGITSLSDAHDEYDELIKKVYVPII